MAEVRREWLDRDYYEDMGLTSAATDEEITAAYKKLVRKLHPDRNPGNKKAEERFKEVSSAYEVIGKPETRRQYDQVSQAGIFGAGPGSAGPTGGGNYQTFNVNVEDLLSGFFGNGQRGGFSQQTGVPHVPLKGNDIETSVNLSFEESMADTIKNVKGYNNKSIKVRIPAGVRDQERIRIASKGGSGSQGGARGDLYVKVSVDKHDLYERKGKNLLLEVPISFAEAALGKNIKIPTFSGQTVEMKIPSGTSSGSRFKIKGHGVPYSKEKVGDLVVTVQVAVPQKLSSKQKKVIQELGDLLDESPRKN